MSNDAQPDDHLDEMDSDLSGDDVGDQGTVAEGIARFIEENPQVGEQIEQIEEGAAWAPEAGDTPDGSLNER
jgi:hypothetical protein